MSLIADRVSPTFKRVVKVRFITDGGTVYEASITAGFKRLDNDAVQELLEREPTNREILEEVLDFVEGISSKDGEAWPADAQKEWAMKTRETVNALALDFLLAYDQTGSVKTSRKQR